MENIIERFYNAFAKLDAESMVRCYHDNITFHDPAFGELKGEKVKNMWRMLCESQKGKDFRVEYSNVNVRNDSGTAQWEAFYTFSKTGRRVYNKIFAEFKFKDGLIISHNDNFNLYKWATQAMGITGTLIGWTPYFKKKLQAKTNMLLYRYESKT